MQIDANDLINHEHHRLTVALEGADDDVLVLICEDEDVEIAREEV